MRRIRRMFGSFMATAGLVVSLAVATATEATAAESMPPLQYPAIGLADYTEGPIAGANGSITLPCTNSNSGTDLVTYNSSGTLVRQLNRTQYVDGVQNCITNPVVDKNDVLYGTSNGKTPSGSYVNGQYLYAYAGSTQKWKYPLTCGSTTPKYAVGATGNIYATASLSDGMHIIGIAPELAAGETQPAKVFDIKVASDCNTELFPYRDGIMLRSQNYGFRFYSYGGQLLAQPSVSRFWDAKLNATGRLFDFTYVAGSNTSVNVSMYDPLTNQTIWTTPASTSGANAQSTTIYPLANGGVVALIREQKMVSPGFPAIPTEYVYSLATLNVAGQKIKSVVLPNSTPQGQLTNIYVSPTSNGKLAIARSLDMNTGLSYPSTVPAVTTGVYDPVTGTWSNQELIAGDIAKVGGPNGYFIDSGPIVPSSNTIALLVKCSGNCSGVKQKLLAVTATDSDADYPRSAVVNTAPRPASPYIALGDSFSAGEGNPPFLSGTDVSYVPGMNIEAVNKCHRSNTAYPQLIAGSSAKIPSFSMGGFRACSGAVSTNIADVAQWNEGTQLDWWPDATTQVVTLTIGGNDIKFGDLAKACIFSSCEIGSTAYNISLSKINNELESKLTATYRAILRYVPNAKVFVVGYPQVMANKGPQDPTDGSCIYMYDPLDGSDHWKDIRAARDIVMKLNQKINGVVTTVRTEQPGNIRLHYVPVDGANSPFIGHEVCGSLSSWFLNVDQAVGSPDYVFHPNIAGHSGYASVVSAVINAS